MNVGDRNPILNVGSHIRTCPVLCQLWFDSIFASSMEPPEIWVPRMLAPEAPPSAEAPGFEKATKSIWTT